MTREREDAYYGYGQPGRDSNSPRLARQKLTPIWGILAYAVGGVMIWLSGLIIVVAGHLLALTMVALWSWLLLGVPGAHRRIVNRRNRERESNLDLVENWIIKTELPPPSPGLAEREAELERLYADHMAKQGKAPDGRQLPDPNSKRSAKRRARRTRKLADAKESIACKVVHLENCGDQDGCCTCDWRYVYPEIKDF